jgi:AcrR family transcriptional regulator
MPNARFKKLPLEKQARILDAATRVFAEHGLEGASINRILADAGLSKGAAYYYFEDKADLFDTVAKRCWKQLIQHIDFSLEDLTAKNFWTRVEAILRHACEHMTTDPVITMMAKMVWRMDSHKSGCCALEEVVEFSHAWVGELVRKGQALGMVRTDIPAELLIAIAVAMDQATDRWMVDVMDKLSAEKVMEITMKVFDGIREMLSTGRKRKR